MTGLRLFSFSLPPTPPIPQPCIMVRFVVSTISSSTLKHQYCVSEDVHMVCVQPKWSKVNEDQGHANLEMTPR